MTLSKKDMNESSKSKDMTKDKWRNATRTKV